MKKKEHAYVQQPQRSRSWAEVAGGSGGSYGDQRSVRTPRVRE